MDLKFLINTILIILLLHLLLKNLNFEKVINIIPNIIKEHLTKNISNLSNDHEKTMNFLLDIEEEEQKKLDNISSDNEEKFTMCTKDNQCYDELVDYVNNCTENVKAGNYYVEDENSANFMSNVLNVHKFYDKNDIPGSYANLTNDQLTSLNNNEKYDPNFLNNIENQEPYPKRNLHTNDYQDNTESFKPDNWNYKNELPMNGGNVVGNVVGFDTLNDGYATFYDKSKIVTNECNNNIDCNLQHDDIRFGLGNPNRENRYNE